MHVWDAEVNFVNYELQILLLFDQPARTFNMIQPYLFISGVLRGSVKSFEFSDSSIYLHPVEEKMHAFYWLSEKVFDMHAV